MENVDTDNMVTDDDNTIIERMVTEGKSAMAIRAAVPNVSRTNIYLKIAKFKKHGTVGRVQTKPLGRPRAMSEGVDKFLQGLLAAKPDMELEEMRRHLQTELQLTVSMSTISRAISRAGVASGQRVARSRNTGGARRRRTKAKGGVDLEQEQDVAQHPQQSPSTLVHEASMETLPELPEDAHLLDPWQDIAASQPASHHAHPQLQPHHLHALDPSLAPAYHPAAVYHNLYAENAHHALAMGPNLEVYRSPYAPM